MRALRTHNYGFTLVELLIVVVILAIMATIVLPQFTDSTEDTKEAALQANLNIVRNVLQRYRAEHYGRGPQIDQNGNADLANALLRLTGRTQHTGLIDAGGPVGPYLTRLPANPFNELDTIRMDGAAPGANTAGWHYNSTTDRFSADDSTEHAAF